MTDVQPPAIAPRRSPVQRRPGPPAKRHMPNSDGSPKVKHAIHLMIWGADDGPDAGLPLSRQAAAKASGIADVTLRNALANPLVMKTFNTQLDVLRNGERPRSIARMAHLRDGARSEQVQFAAAKYLDGGDKHQGVTVNVNTGVALIPGYQVAMGTDMADAGRQMLKLAGSTRSVADISHDVPTDGQGWSGNARMMQRTQPAIAPVVDTSPRVVSDPVRDGGGLEIGRKTYVRKSRNSFSPSNGPEV